MKHPDLNSANSYLFTLEWRKYFWVFDLFGSFIAEGNLDKKYVATVNIRFSCKWWFATEKVKNGACRIEALSKCQTLWEYPIEITKIFIHVCLCISSYHLFYIYSSISKSLPCDIQSIYYYRLSFRPCQLQSQSPP